MTIVTMAKVGNDGERLEQQMGGVVQQREVKSKHLEEGGGEALCTGGRGLFTTRGKPIPSHRKRRVFQRVGF